ncbi:GGDEF domain-containing protein [Rheinheimera sp. WS51]|uniref:GGDEF domain-containing protein n=1 Tax=Rheinheimera sp. WS51 TaxID=3425886 RepID=UPI003D8B3BB1
MDYALLQDLGVNQAPCYAAITKVQHWPEQPQTAEQSLVSQLQTTLDIHEQLNIVSMAVGKLLPLSSLQLHTAAGDFTASGSKAGQYEHRSMLILNQQCLAELVYQSDNAFTPMMQRQLLQLETEWLFALRNALVVSRLQQMALKDTLTGLGNRRFFDDSLNKAVQLAHRHNESCGLLLLDLDNFKQVNDISGHTTGDELLIAVANIVRETLRATDTVFRFGGDEFAIILSAADAASAELIARRLLKAINQLAISKQYQVTVSIGLALLQPKQDQTALFNAADTALYQAKNAGKSTVRFAQ